MPGGRKPTATIIKLARGNPGRRPLPQNEPIVTGAPTKPPKLGKRANELWEEVTRFASWLTAADGYKLHVWCELQAEFERAPSKMVSARIAQLRAVGSELGLDPGSRARLGTIMPGRTDAERNKETVESKFFDRHRPDLIR
jgi:phage terminase small subunit